MIALRQLSAHADLPIFVCDLSPLHEPLKLAREGIEELRITHPESPISNVKAEYMTPWRSHLLTPKFKPLIDVVLQVGQEAGKLLSPSPENPIPEMLISECWGVIYEKSSYTQPHNHFPSDFACAIYLEAHDNSAPIIFSGKYPVQPKPNMLVMFPGILTHEVPATEGRRVVVVMNLHQQATFANVQLPVARSLTESEHSQQN
jgi:hypothetical protein